MLRQTKRSLPYNNQRGVNHLYLRAASHGVVEGEFHCRAKGPWCSADRSLLICFTRVPETSTGTRDILSPLTCKIMDGKKNSGEHTAS